MSSVPSQSPAPPVIAVQKSESAVPDVPKRLSDPDTARLVDVADVPVALTKVKFWRVVELLARILSTVRRLVASL